MTFEKVNPNHPDKIADRIAGALVDLAYTKQENPKVAVEVLLGHDTCLIITESSVEYTEDEIGKIIERIAGKGIITIIKQVQQDVELAKNQEQKIRCGDNGIFKGVPTSAQEKALVNFVEDVYKEIPYDGKYIIDGFRIIACQSHTDELNEERMKKIVDEHKLSIEKLNPLGRWTGGINVDSGATNRKLGSDMGRATTGGGLHGKDLSKADVSVNIYAHLKAQETGEEVELHCAIGDEMVDGKPYAEIVEIARDYIDSIGGFEKFAEWGLIR